jgi:hypothetical protein
VAGCLLKQAHFALRARQDAACYGMRASRFLATMGGQLKEANMSFDVVAIDPGNQSFHLHGVDSDGIVLSKKVRRTQLIAAESALEPSIVAMKACPGALLAVFSRSKLSCAPDPAAQSAARAYLWPWARESHAHRSRQWRSALQPQPFLAA